MMHLRLPYFALTPRASGKLPDSPHAHALNRAIPLFFIGRNKHGFWLAREARGRIGGMFFLRRSAYRFVQQANAPHGFATMFLAKPFELGTRNAGNPVVGWLDAAVGLVSRFVPDYPPPIPIAEKYRKRDWLGA
jgi:hypothetical protein